SWSVFISTNAKPLDCPVARSAMMWTDSTVPNGAKSFSRSALLTPWVRLPTYSFLPIVKLLEKRRSRAPWDVRGPPGRARSSQQEIVDVVARQDHHEAGPLSLAGVNRQRAAALLHQELHHGQPDPQASGPRRPGPVEQVQHPLAVPRRQPDAVVRHAELVALRRGPQSQLHPRLRLVRVTVLQRVGEEVVQDVSQSDGEPLDVLALQLHPQHRPGGTLQPLLPAED